MNDLFWEQLCQSEEEDTIYLPNKKFKKLLQELVEAVKTGDENGCLMFHQLLTTLNKKRLSINTCSSPLQEQCLINICTYLEEEWLKLERLKIAPELSEIPTEADEFVEWFENLEQTGYGQHHSLFMYLAERASREELQYFFQQEFSTEAGFDDLVALTQVKASPQVKMELAHNYWDEMGRGNAKGVHSFLLQRVSDNLGLIANENNNNVHWAPLALSNTMIAFATKRSRFYQSIGALGVIELTAPGRCLKVIQGLKRIGVSSDDYHYYTLHASLDQKHWAGWRENAMRPLLEEAPTCMAGIAEGALLRLRAGQQCFEAYSKHLKLDLNLKLDNSSRATAPHPV